MMKLVRNIAVMFMLVVAVALPQAAQSEGEGGMPAFGPPQEMSQVAMFVGSWKYQGEMRMDSTAPWTPHSATAVFSLVCGGAILQEDFTGQMMGMEMKGLCLIAYDRETKKWQALWTDNFASRLSIYEGDFTNGRLVVSGKDPMQGMTIYSRTTFYDVTDKSIKWTMENSMDGQNWFVSMKGTYTKQ